MSATDIVKKLSDPFPPQALRQREGQGGKRFTYVEGQTVIRRLNEATEGRWDMRIVNTEWRADLLIVTVELTIPGLGSRQHIGVQRVSERGGEDLLKGAVTDAMKKAATLFGVGIDLYGADYESDDYAPPPTPTQHSVPRPTPANGGTDAPGAEACGKCGASLTNAERAHAKQFKHSECTKCRT